MLLMPVCGNEDIWSRAEVFWWPCRTTFGWTTSWGKDCKAALASTSNCRKVAERATDEVLMHKILIPMDNLSISTGFPWISGFWFSNDRALPSTSPTAPGMFASQKACAVFVHGSDFGEDFLGGFSQAGTTIQLGVGRIARFGFGIPGKRRGDFPTLILMDDVLPRCFLSIFRWEFGFLIWTEKGGKKTQKSSDFMDFEVGSHNTLRWLDEPLRGLSEAMAAHYPLDDTGHTWRLKLEKLERGGRGMWLNFYGFHFLNLRETLQNLTPKEMRRWGRRKHFF